MLFSYNIIWRLYTFSIDTQYLSLIQCNSLNLNFLFIIFSETPIKGILSFLFFSYILCLFFQFKKSISFRYFPEKCQTWSSSSVNCFNFNYVHICTLFTWSVSHAIDSSMHIFLPVPLKLWYMSNNWWHLKYPANQLSVSTCYCLAWTGLQLFNWF